MKRLLICVLALCAGPLCFAQDITLKTGQVIATKGVRRSGDTIIATVALQSTQGGGPTTGEFGYPLSQIATIAFPRPYQLQTAADSINAGKPQVALQQLQPILNYYEGFRDAPGSWWADAVLLKVRALISAGSASEAAQLSQQLGQEATTPDVAAAAHVYGAAALASQGAEGQALQLLQTIQRGTQWPEALALAALYEGEIHVKHEEWEPALLSLLQIPVFYPDQSTLLPAVRLWTARAYLGLRDIPRAKAALDDLAAKYAATPEAAEGQKEVARMAKLSESLPQPQK
jgi:hypothetical protein